MQSSRSRRWRSWGSGVGGLCAVIRPLMSPQESFWVLSAGVLLQEGLWVHLDFISELFWFPGVDSPVPYPPKRDGGRENDAIPIPPTLQKKLELFFSCDNSLAPGSTREVLTCRRRRLPSQSPRQTLARRLHTPIKFGRPPPPPPPGGMNSEMFGPSVSLFCWGLCKVGWTGLPGRPATCGPAGAPAPLAPRGNAYFSYFSLSASLNCSG